MAQISIRLKLLLGIGLPTLAAGALGAAVMRDRADQEIRAEARAELSSVSLIARSALKLPSEDATRAQLTELPVQTLQVIRPDGTVRFSNDLIEQGKPLSPADRARVDACVARPQECDRERVVRLETGDRLRIRLPHQHVLPGSGLGASALTGAIFGAFLALAVFLAVHWVVTRRLRRLSAVMARAAGGDLVVRAEVDGDDELDQLGAAFNTLLATLTEMKVTEIDAHRSIAAASEQLELKRILEEKNVALKHRVAELSLLYDLARAFTSTLDLPELLTRIRRLVVDSLDIPQFSVMLLAGVDRLEVKSSHPPRSVNEAIVFRVGEGACGRAAETQKTIYIADLESDQTLFVQRPGSQERGSLLCVPMVHKDALLGVLNFQRPEKAAFSREDIELLTAVADQVSLAVANALLHEETVALSITDPLTGAPNRRHLFARLEMEIARAQRFGTQLSVLMIDIDHFKLLNDTAGHRAGDVVLRQVFERMKQMTRKVDILARYGGEEFMVVLPQVAKPEAAEVAEKLRRAIEGEPFAHAKSQPGGRITVSIGVANLPTDADTLELLVDCADSALYASKRAGRNAVTAYARGMEQHPGRERGPNVQRRPRLSQTS